MAISSDVLPISRALNGQLIDGSFLLRTKFSAKTFVLVSSSKSHEQLDSKVEIFFGEGVRP